RDRDRDLLLLAGEEAPGGAAAGRTTARSLVLAGRYGGLRGAAVPAARSRRRSWDRERPSRNLAGDAAPRVRLLVLRRDHRLAGEDLEVVLVLLVCRDRGRGRAVADHARARERAHTVRGRDRPRRHRVRARGLQPGVQREVPG